MKNKFALLGLLLVAALAVLTPAQEKTDGARHAEDEAIRQTALGGVRLRG